MSDHCPAAKECIFSAIRYCEKCTGESNSGKEKAEKGSLQKLMPIIYVKGSCFETPLYDHVLGNKRDSDKDEV